MKQLETGAVMLIALLGTVSFTIVKANWNKIFGSEEKEVVVVVAAPQEGQKLVKQPAQKVIYQQPIESVKEEVENSETVLEVKPKPKSKKTLTGNGIRFDFFGCQKNFEIRCDFEVTSLMQDATIQIEPDKSRIIADGLIYNGKITGIGGVTNSTYVKANLVKDVPLKAYITYSNVENSNKLDVLEIRFSNKTLGVDRGFIRIKNVTLDLN